MTKFSLLLLFFLPFISFSQSYKGDPEKFPGFAECANVQHEQEEECFTATLKKIVLENFKVPEVVEQEAFEGEVVVLFEVTREGKFVPIYVDAVYPEIKTEINRLFERLPVVEPATYQGRPISIQFRMPIKLPLNRNKFTSVEIKKEVVGMEQEKVTTVPKPYSEIKSLQFEHPRAYSNINIPFSHELYQRFEQEVNRVGTNFHTASKPFLFQEVQPYYDFGEEIENLQKPADSWLSRKLWNEHLFTFQGEDYWFTVDFALDMQVGKDLDSELDVTYNNTRAAIFQGGLGKDLNFYAVVYENQGRFADYYNRYAESIRPGSEGAAIVPGRGIAKSFMGQAYDYPVAEAYLSYSPGKFFNIQFGHGKNFIGDGYRSLLLK